MPLVTIKIIEGRTKAQKRKMVKDVTDAIVKSIGCPTDAVHLDIIEMKQENVGDGGRLFCDIHK
jgi:4-oxalocrotonate tautomerase